MNAHVSLKPAEANAAFFAKLHEVQAIARALDITITRYRAIPGCADAADAKAIELDAYAKLRAEMLEALNG